MRLTFIEGGAARTAAVESTAPSPGSYRDGENALNLNFDQYWWGYISKEQGKLLRRALYVTVNWFNRVVFGRIWG